MKKAPWPDYEGNDLFDGDKIRHPSGQTGLIFYQAISSLDETDNWLVQYHGGPASRLCLQIGDKGKAVKSVELSGCTVPSSEEEQINNEEFTKIETDIELVSCPFCGSPAELWEHAPPGGYIRKAVMCSNSGNKDKTDDECPMYLPNSGFYKATKREAIELWNTRHTPD